MKKIIALILALMCCGCFFACTDDAAGGNNNDNEPAYKIDENATFEDVDIVAIKDKMIAELEIDDAMDMGDNVIRGYGIADEDIKEKACFITMGGTFVSESIIIKAKDADAAKRVAEKLEVRLTALLEQAKGYDPSEYEVAQECEVKTYGHIVTLFFAPKHQGMTEIVESTLAAK